MTIEASSTIPLSTPIYRVFNNTEDQEPTAALPSSDDVIYPDDEDLGSFHGVILYTGGESGELASDEEIESLCNGYTAAKHYVVKLLDEAQAWNFARAFPDTEQGDQVLHLCMSEPSYGSVADAIFCQDKLWGNRLENFMNYHKDGLEMDFYLGILLATWPDTSGTAAARRFISYEADPDLDLEFFHGVAYAGAGYSAEQVKDAIAKYGSSEAAVEAAELSLEGP